MARLRAIDVEEIALVKAGYAPVNPAATIEIVKAETAETEERPLVRLFKAAFARASGDTAHITHYHGRRQSTHRVRRGAEGRAVEHEHCPTCGDDSMLCSGHRAPVEKAESGDEDMTPEEIATTVDAAMDAKLEAFGAKLSALMGEAMGTITKATDEVRTLAQEAAIKAESAVGVSTEAKTTAEAAQTQAGEAQTQAGEAVSKAEKVEAENLEKARTTPGGAPILQSSNPSQKTTKDVAGLSFGDAMRQLVR